MSLIKICGLRRQADIDMCNEGKPDFIGFVMAPGRRQISPLIAAALKARLSREIKAVGVFVNDVPQVIAEMAEAGTIDLIQLHGDEDTEYIAALRELTEKPIIKAVRIKDGSELAAASKLPCDYLLLDTYHPDTYGGSGQTFDWSVIKDIDKPFFLAGGLTPDNIAEAAETAEPYALDISSGVEKEGMKDRELVLRAIAAVRSGS